MGTSSARPSPSGKNPLIPSWAQSESPTITHTTKTHETATFRAFRSAFSKYASTPQDSGLLRRGLNRYAKKTSGDESIFFSRIFNALEIGDEILKELTTTQPPQTQSKASEKLSKKINELYSKKDLGGDTDKIVAALSESISVLFSGKDPASSLPVSDEKAKIFYINFLAQIIFRQLIEDAGNAFNKANTPNDKVSREKELFEQIFTQIENSFPNFFPNNTNELSFINMSPQIIGSMWEEWRKYHD